MNTDEAILTLTALARGERPWSLRSRETEEVLNVTLALLIEHSVALDRLDRLERVVAERTGMPLEELRALDFPSGAASEERAEATAALFARVLRIQLDPRAGEGAKLSEPP